MEYREETVSEIPLDSNQAMLITHPHTNTQSDTHTHIISAKEQGRMKADERAGKKITGKAKLKNTAENYADNQNAEIFTRAEFVWKDWWHIFSARAAKHATLNINFV